MRIELPSGTAAELVHPPSGPAGRGLVVIPDVMGMRPLFDDLVAHLAAEGTGFPTGGGPVPIVVGLSLYDLLEGDGSVRPGPAV